MSLEPEEIEKRDIELPENRIRKGGKQPSGKPPLKHSNFYYCFSTGIHLESYPDKEELKLKIKNIIVEMSNKIIDEFLIIQGSDQGEKSYKLPKNDSKEKLLLRIEGVPKIKYQIEIGKQTGLLYVHYLFAIAKRGLDTQINDKDVKNFFDLKLGVATTLKPHLYRDAKCNIEIYSQKANII